MLYCRGEGEFPCGAPVSNKNWREVLPSSKIIVAFLPVVIRFSILEKDSPIPKNLYASSIKSCLTESKALR